MKRVFALSLLLSSACSAYPNWDGRYNQGPADPVDYPPPYLGVGGDRARPATGSFTEIAAVSAGKRIGYYAFPFATTLTATTANGPKPDPLALQINGAPSPDIATPVVEVFDGVIGKSPFPSRPVCVPPVDYVYDQRRDDVHYDEQAPVFSALPVGTYSFSKAPSWAYMPIVAEKGYTNTGACQTFRQVETPAPTSGDGFYLAWPIIDTGARVYRVGETSKTSNGLGPQRFGWYASLLVAYLDGGYIPTRTDTAMDGTTSLHMVTQRLYYPRSLVKNSKTSAAGTLGQGYDVITTPRGTEGYSPVCEVYTYDAGMELTPDQLPQDAETITTNFAMTLKPATPAYFFCLQVQ